MTVYYKCTVAMQSFPQMVNVHCSLLQTCYSIRLICKNAKMLKLDALSVSDLLSSRCCSFER